MKAFGGKWQRGVGIAANPNQTLTTRFDTIESLVLCIGVLKRYLGPCSVIVAIEKVPKYC